MNARMVRLAHCKTINDQGHLGFLRLFPVSYTHLDVYKRQGYDNLKMLASINKGEVDISGALETVGLNPQDKRKYRKYSLGMKQRLGSGTPRHGPGIHG